MFPQRIISIRCIGKKSLNRCKFFVLIGDRKTPFQRHYDGIMGAMKFTKFELFLEQLRLGGGAVLGKAQDKHTKMVGKVDFGNIRDSQINKKEPGRRFSQMRGTVTLSEAPIDSLRES
jgi:hypothetical protein